MKRRIGIVTTARSEFGIYRPLLYRIAAEPQIDFGIFLGGTHRQNPDTDSVREIHENHWPIWADLNCPPEGDTPWDTVRTIGRTTIAMADALKATLPDLIVVLGDRFEMHAAGAAVVPFNIPMVHIHGGELSIGAIDDSFRHSLTKLSHLHFPSTEAYARRIIQMGEEPWRVKVCGAPSIDAFFHEEPLSPENVMQRFGIKLSPSPVLVTLHPETRGQTPPDRLADAMVKALQNVEGPIVITAPNCDPGGGMIADRLKAFSLSRPQTFYVENLGARAYRTVLAHASVMVGNSSSGIIEAPSFALPVVNVGSRQDARLRASNVIDVDADEDAIAGGIAYATNPEFRMRLHGMANPYGDGHAAERIVSVLRQISLDDRLLRKQFHDLNLEP